MKNANITVTIENDSLVIARKRYRNASYLFARATVKCSERKLPPIDSCLNCVRVPADVKLLAHGKYCTLVNPSNGRFVDVLVDGASDSAAGQIDLTAFVAESVGANAGDELILCDQNSSNFGSVKLQKMDAIKNDSIALPPTAAVVALLQDFCLFEVINPLTNDSIFVRSKYVKVDAALKPDEIRINQKQRNMLSDNIPTRLTAQQWDEIRKDETVNAAIKQALTRSYTKDKGCHTINVPIDEMEHEVKLSLRSFMRERFGESLIVRPVLESFHYEKKPSLYRRMCNLYVGKSVLSLNCRRPHECDENADIVRMTENNMRFLGIGPMDKVVIQYKEKTVSCHVLPFCDEKFAYTNTPSVIELSIGIPAHVRRKLGVTDIQSSVKVNRDTAFIFKSSFNEQLVPLILTLLSLRFFEDIAWYFSVLLLLVLVPIVMYITLSSKRNMCGR
ncbi:MAG: hypothetical protein IJB26_06130 [Clostridia bacterium]|nr:hypothetical protein [Clostridia bacterium]